MCLFHPSGPLEASRYHAGKHRASPQRYRCARRRWQHRGHLVESPDEVTPQPIPSGDLHSPSGRLQGRCSRFPLLTAMFKSLCSVGRVVKQGCTNKQIVLVVTRAARDMFECPWPQPPYRASSSSPGPPAFVGPSLTLAAALPAINFIQHYACCR